MSVELNPHKSTVQREVREVLALHHRHLSQEQLHKFEGYMAEIFTALGLDLDTSSTSETPARFIRAMVDATSASLR
jgi:GTP cyclohydrolase I